MPSRIPFISLISLAVLLLTLTACETMGGAGRDIEDAGQSIQKSAD